MPTGYYKVIYRPAMGSDPPPRTIPVFKLDRVPLEGRADTTVGHLHSTLRLECPWNRLRGLYSGIVVLGVLGGGTPDLGRVPQWRRPMVLKRFWLLPPSQHLGRMDVGT